MYIYFQDQVGKLKAVSIHHGERFVVAIDEKGNLNDCVVQTRADCEEIVRLSIMLETQGFDKVYQGAKFEAP